MKSNPIPHHYLQATMAGALKQGWSPEQLLQQAQLPLQLLTSPEQPITEQQLSRLTRTVWRCIDDEFLGLSGQPCPTGTFSLMAELVIHSQTLGGMLKQSTRFYSTLRNDVDISLEIVADQADIQLSLKDPSQDPDHLLQEFLLLMWQRFSSWLVGHHIAPLACRFNYPQPERFDEYRLMFGTELKFNQPCCGYTLNAKQLNLPLVRSPAELKLFLANSPAVILRRPRQDETLKRQVLQILMNQDTAELPTLNSIAEQLHLTTRTLRRKLTQEGAQFRQLKDAIRRDKAIRLLTQENMSIGQVSHHTGFTEPAAFCRAFKKWTGTQPSNYRRNPKI
ncbi:MAG: AraC family transcriptional regulator [Halopseudomonas sp.]